MMTSGEKAVRELLGDAGLDTREDYIWAAWGNEPPEPWTADLEAQLPEDLQDWTLFEKRGDELVYKGA